MMTKPLFLSYCALAGMVLTGAGCKSSGGGNAIPQTPSGLPEITLRAKSEAEIKRVVAEFFRARGYAETRSEYVNEMAFDKPTKGDKSQRALRIRLKMHKQPDATWRLVGTPLGVDGWRTDLESELVLLEGASQIQGFLAEIKSRVESAKP